MSTSASRGSARQYARRSLQFVLPHRRTMCGVLTLALLMAAMSAADPLIMKYLFDQLGGGRNLRLLGAVIGGLLLLELARGYLSGRLSVLSWDVRLAVEYRVRELIVGKLNALPVSYHQREGVGGTINRVNQAISGFVTAFSDIAFNILPTLLYLALSVLAMTRLDWRLSLVVLVFTPLPAIIGARAAPEQTQRERRLVERWTSVYARFNEVLAGIVTVKSFGMEEVEKRRVLREVRESLDIVREGIKTDTRSGVLRALSGTMARLVAIGLGGVLVWKGEITVGTLVAFLGYIGGLFGPVQNLTNSYQSLRRASVSLETIFGILDMKDAVSDEPDALELANLLGDVRFEDVGFCYDEGKSVLRGINLHVRAGETIAVVGPSGSGKSTLMSLLQRLYVPTTGRILMDGRDVRWLTQKSLRRQISVVLQDPYLFNDTIRANIAYGRPDASDAEIESAARAANAHEFIIALPGAYDTPVRERGTGLSSGQRQRIAIARALLRNSPVIILDEPTSALDTPADAATLDGLATLLRGRTAFIVAHRLSTVMSADRIVVLKDGSVAETGSHEELVQQDGYYAAMVRQQTKGFLADEAAEIRAA